MPEPVRSKDVDWQEWQHNERVRVRSKILNDGPDVHMGVCIQELPAGCNTRPAHYHMKEEEHVFVLKGAMNVRLGKEEYELSAGDYICFAAGDAQEHCLFNPNEESCEFVRWGERREDDIIVYPDSNKVSVGSLGELYRREPVDYWDGEET
ncbi:MAG: cupin domain-containing protein [Pseudomonadota bacterium]